MKSYFQPVLGIFLIASLGTSAMAGPTLKGAMVNPEPTMLADIQVMQREPLGPEVADDLEEHLLDLIVQACNDMGGGVSTDPDVPSGKSCYDPDGHRLD